MTTEILKPTSDTILKAAGLIQKGCVVGMPTETVYGLAGDAFNEEALLSIFKTKSRPTFDPLIIHVAFETNQQALEELVRLELVDESSLTEVAKSHVNKLTATFWPGPLTLVLPKTKKVPDLATSGLPTVAVRMPSHPVAQSLIQAAGTPVAAPSANRFGKISPTCAEHVAEELGGLIPLILDGDSSEIGLESTIVAVHASGALTLLRPGKISLEEIKKVSGAEVQKGARVVPANAPQEAPGMLASHYAPTKPLTMLPEKITELPLNFFENKNLPARLGLLTFDSKAKSKEALSKLTRKEVFCETLTETGNLEEAARNLFAKLRTLDHSEAEVLFTEPCPSSAGIGYAITDRLVRACTPRS